LNIPVSPDTISFAQAEQLSDILSKNESLPAIIHCGSGNRVGALWALYYKLRYRVGAKTALTVGIASGLTNSNLIEITKALLEA